MYTESHWQARRKEQRTGLCGERALQYEEGKVYTAANLDKAISAINKLGVFRKRTRADCTVIRLKSSPGTVDILIRLEPKAPVGKATKSK